MIGALPATVTLDASEATTGPTDPGYCPAPEWGQDPATVWFEHTATSTGALGATTYGSDYPTTLYVGTADGNGGLDVIGCATQSGGTAQSAVRFDAEAGVTYLFAVGLDPNFGEPAGNLVFNLDVAGPALTVDIEVEPTAELVRDGVAIVRGTFTCTAPTTFSTVVFVELTQVTGNRETHGFGLRRHHRLPCGRASVRRGGERRGPVRREPRPEPAAGSRNGHDPGHRRRMRPVRVRERDHRYGCRARALGRSRPTRPGSARGRGVRGTWA